MPPSMRAAIAPRRSPTPVNPPLLVDRSKTIRHIRALIWLYLILLIFEGALRKWVVPQLSNPLLIVRDPVVLVIYFLAARARVFPWNRYVSSLTALAFFSCIAGLLALEPYLPPTPLLAVTAFGFRSN